MVSAQLAAQSVSSLCDGTESGIKRIVLYWSSASGIDPPRSEPESGAPPLLNRKPNWKRIQLLGYDPYRCDSKDWPVITDFSATRSVPAAISLVLAVVDLIAYIS